MRKNRDIIEERAPQLTRSLSKMPKLCLVCSSGGHLYELYCLKEFWQTKDHFWVSFPTQDAKYLLNNERKYWAHFPTNRNIVNLFKNFVLALRLLFLERPDFLISTGAGLAVPFILVSKILGIKTVYIESITRITELSLTGRIIYPVVDMMLVQWPELAPKFQKAKYEGQIL